MTDTVDVRCFADRDTLVIDARLHPADVVAHDEENVRFGVLGRSGSWRQKRGQTCSENSCHGRHWLRPVTTARPVDLIFSNREHTHRFSSSSKGSPNSARIL